MLYKFSLGAAVFTAFVAGLAVANGDEGVATLFCVLAGVNMACVILNVDSKN